MSKEGRVVITRASRRHVAVLAPLFDAYRRFYGRRASLPAARRFLADRIDRRESVIFVAFTGRAPREAVGFVQLYPSFSSTAMRRIWILNDLYVRPEARRAGVARRLLARARRHAHDTHAAALSLQTARTNRKARALYESAGWTRETEFLQYWLRL